MIIKDDSPLRRLPSGLDIRQKYYFNGIRYSIEVIDLAYERLKQTLYVITNDFISKKSERSHSFFLSAIFDAWSLIDFIYRLRGLLNQCPGIKKNSPGYVTFFKKTDHVETLRHCFQHLNQIYMSL